MASVLPPIVEALPDGVGRVSLPTPFRVGRVNCYVLTERPVTVIDPGTLQRGSLAQLRDFLKSHGLDFDDVEQIIVTHHHADHCGAAAVLAARSQARIVCGHPEVSRLIEPVDFQSRRALLVRLGVPDETASSLIETTDAAVDRLVRRPHPDMVTPMRDGDVLTAGGRRLECIVTPGHARGHLSLWDPDARVLFSGDHLLPRIIPVPSLEADDDRRRRHSMIEYLGSLPRFVALHPEVVLPGHGGAFTAVDVLAARLRSHAWQRAGEIETILRAGPANTFEISHSLQWQPDEARLLFGLAHVQGHLDLLEDAGRVSPEQHADVVAYRLRT
jgi:glyoxylase-like metal-dependent hydrolase (beta-lactamase superfamily II)